MKSFKKYLGEKLKASDDMGTWVKDFQDSDAPQFKGKSQKKRQQMAVAAKLSAERNEEVELDEANMSSVAKELEAYARKNGGIDKMDFMKAAMMMKKGQKKQLMKFIDELDTEPREKILFMMSKEAGK